MVTISWELAGRSQVNCPWASLPPEHIDYVANFPWHPLIFFFPPPAAQTEILFKLGCQSPISFPHLIIAPSLQHNVTTCLRKSRNWLAIKQIQILSNSPNWKFLSTWNWLDKVKKTMYSQAVVVLIFSLSTQRQRQVHL